MGRAVCFVASVMLFTSTPVFAQTNSWINPVSGNWQDATSWSLGVPPGASQSVMITNSGFKAVGIQSSTASGFPQTLSVHSVTIASSTNSANTLLMNFVGAGNPLVVGVDSNNPGSLVIGDTNSAMVMLSSGLIVNNTLGTNNSHVGAFEVDGTFTQSDSSEVVAGFLDLNNGGTYNLTNGQLFVGSQFINGTFNQEGGTNLGAVIFTDGGKYNLFDGLLQGGVAFDAPFGGQFIQSGGTNMGSLGLDNPGVYQLSGGLLLPGDLFVGPSELLPSSVGAGAVEQTGGTVNAGNITMGVGSYTLAGGVLTASNLALPTASSRLGSAGTSFDQSGGFFSSGSVTMNGVVDNGLQPSTYTLSGGELQTPSISMTIGLFVQIGGTNNVGGLTLNTASSCDFTNGLLIVDNILVSGQATFVHAGGSFSGADNVLLAGGSWLEQTSGEQLGQLQLIESGSNSTLNLPAGPTVLRFADSSSLPWANGATLTISNWSGSLNGGGSQQVFFGTSASGLTAPQLSHLQFSNPAGLPSGTYSAQILSDGEVVPNQGPPPPPGLVNSWINPASGNWDDATSWSLGVLPNSSQLVLITNSGFKAVAINPSTPINFPGSMTVTNLMIGGATNSENTLLLNFFGTAIPLTVLNGLTLRDNAQILDFSSGLVVQSGMFTVTNSQINQDGGFIVTTNAPLSLEDSAYNLTNGDLEASNVSLGFPVSARFNQFGGTVTIADLEFGGNVAGSGGAYALYGGNLNLPGGMNLQGNNGAFSSYFQAGGTNLTGSVFLEPGIFGTSPSFTLNGGLLADSQVTLESDDFGEITLFQNGGTHIVTNALDIIGGTFSLTESHPAAYQLNDGTLTAGSVSMDATMGAATFNQTNGSAQVGLIQAQPHVGQSYFVSAVNLSGGALTCSNLSITDGGNILQSGGVFVASNSLAFSGFIQPGPRFYASYTLLGGTLIASNISVGGNLILGDSTTNRISNPGVCSLSQLIVISNAVEQLGRFILASNATINLAGSASRLSFANSSGETWAGGATLVISNWNGNPSGGGAEQLKFGTDQSGLTAAQLNQIHFDIGTNLYSAKILSTGEVVPNQVIPASIAFSREGNNLVLTWPTGWTLLSATNAAGPYTAVTGATSPYTINTTAQPQQFFRLQQ